MKRHPVKTGSITLKAKCTALLLSLAMVFGMTPAVSAGVFAESGSSDDAVLQEMARQMQDKDADPFAFRDGEKGLKAAESYPKKFDLRDVDGDGVKDKDPSDDCYVTPVKFQNPFGTCWGFAGIAAAETSILGNKAIRGDMTADTIDLSEKHLVWFTYQPIKDTDSPQYGEGAIFDGPDEVDTLNQGGFTFYGTSVFATGRGPVLENVENDGSLEYHGKERLVTLRDGDDRYVKQEDEISSDEEKAKMYCYSDTDDWSVPEENRYLQSYRLKESYILPTPSNKTGSDRTKAINAIKSQLMAKRAVEIAFCADTSDPGEVRSPKPTKYISPSWAHYTYEEKSANHAVTIVGWDDNYRRTNFRHEIEGKNKWSAYSLTTPANDGAWLVKNSWGSSEREFPHKGPGWGIVNSKGINTGYFWISYDDMSMKMIEALDFDISNIDDEYLLYQHDYMPVSEVDSAYLSAKTSMANVFTSELPSRIEQLSCETTAPGTKVHYELYFLNDDAADPTDGKKMAEIDAEYTYGGFHKETLDTPVTAATGQRFSVIVTQKTPDDRYSINLQAALNKNFLDEYNKDKSEDEKRQSYCRGVINEGESFFNTGSKWLDLSEKWVQDFLIGEEDCEYLDVDNFAIKVFAKEGEEPDTPDTPETPETPDKSDVKPADSAQQTGAGGTAFGKGASAEAAEAAALAWKENTDPEGTAFAPLMLSSRQSRKSIELKWKKRSGASSYVIYGAKDGNGNSLQKLASVSGSSYNVKKLGTAGLKKGKYYKFMVVALDKNNNVITSSKLIHAATKGGGSGNYKKVKITKPAKEKLDLKTGRTYKIKARATGRNVKKKIGLRYESDKPAVAEVSSKGKIKAVGKGSCKIRVYAQNGIYKTIKLRVK